MSQTIDEVKDAKKKLELLILREMRSFESRYGVEIQDWGIDRPYERVGGGRTDIMLVQLEVKL